MPSESLDQIISGLTPERQAAVRDFIEFLQGKAALPQSPFLAAINEFIDEHPELLARLAR